MQKPKGTYDVFGEYGKKVLIIENILKDLMTSYNYEYFRTPIFEISELFHRGVGETTDIVSKETYTFKDRGNRSMTLRPEGTAGVVRSYVENKLYADPTTPLKTWYYGPMFRYERPQSGRHREFYQFGVEVLGSENPATDAEVISVAVNFYKLLGLKGIKVKLNSLGDELSRTNYRNALLKYFKPHFDDLSIDSQNRYEKNPLRILDSKDEMDKKIVANAPQMSDYLTVESTKRFNDVKQYLELLNIEYEIDDNLVRGLDYYTHTVFEIEADIKGFGSQNVLCGGGRYNNLVSEIGGPNTPGIGFAMGIERLLIALEHEEINLITNDGVDAYIIPLDNNLSYVLKLTQELRDNLFITEFDHMNRSLKSNFKQSERLNAKFVIIIGNDEIEKGIVTIKNNKTKEEYQIEEDYILNFLEEKVSEWYEID